MGKLSLAFAIVAAGVANVAIAASTPAPAPAPAPVYEFKNPLQSSFSTLIQHTEYRGPEQNNYINAMKLAEGATYVSYNTTDPDFCIKKKPRAGETCWMGSKPEGNRTFWSYYVASLKK